MRVLITGGTGFVGKHLLDVIASGATSLSMNDVVIASRSPHVTGHDVETVIWDVTSGSVPKLQVDAVIHAATPASAELNATSPRLMFDQIVEGARRVIEFCVTQPDPPRVVFTSSGAVYGEMPPEIMAWTEDSHLAADPLDVKNAYASGKRAAEALLSFAGHEGVCRPTVARLFAFSGRHLPLDRHFALGNFVHDAVSGRPIRIRGDGSAIRSYLDGDDLAQWVLAAVFAEIEAMSPLHLGSENPLSILELGRTVAEVSQNTIGITPEIIVSKEHHPFDGRERYVPSTERTRRYLNVDETVQLAHSIEQMLRAASGLDETR